MNRAEKQQWIDDTNKQVASAEILIIAHYKGLNVAEMTQLRRNIRAAGASFKVTKNSLAHLALKDTPYEGLSDMFKGPTAVAYANDAVAASKAMHEFAKKNDKLVLLGGAFNETVLDKAAIQQLASLPSLDELRAKIIALLSTPATRIAGVLQAPAGQLARVFGAYGAKDAA
jgi:large subunit ribosomal protein L10